MKITHEQLGEWVATCPNLYSARLNGDVETIANEARAQLNDPDISHEDVNKAAEAFHTKQVAARQATEAAAAQAATGEAQGEGQAG